jgi:hypothetical protein
MFLITKEGKEDEGAYSVVDEDGDSILYLFEDEDDACRFAMMLEEQEFPEMHVIEVEDGLIIRTCEIRNCRYTLITPNDIVIPPPYHDFI